MSGPPADVLVVGSVNIDLVVAVERLPAAGETVTGGVFARHHGGKGANQAVAAARLDAAVAFVGAVGDDEDGQAALADLRAEGVDVDGVSVLAGVPTGAALIVVDGRGENQIAVASGANAALDGLAVERALAGLRFTDGAVCLLNFEIGDEALVAAARWASRRDLKLVVNAAPARPLPVELLQFRPVLLLNRSEATQLTDEPEPITAARDLAGRSGAPVVITLGSEGALLVAGSGADIVEARRVRAVDTTGAGDAFAGALAAEVARGAELRAAVGLAVAASALSVTGSGARAGMPTRAQMQRP